MKQKIEWYKEVLELEPGSRIFFPLAKLLAAEGQLQDAVLTLRQGLGRHPDHVEARLMLVELLSRQDTGGTMEREIDDLGALFAAYPGFWQAWSERLASVPAMHDASLAMRFFSSALQGKKLTWGQVIETGLRALIQEQALAPQAAYTPPAPVFGHDEPEDLGVPAVPAKGIAEALSTPYDDAATPPAPQISSPTARESRKSGQAAAEGGAAESRDAQGESSEEDDPEEGFTLRTRSMAEVLAEQGDYAAAADIYQELLERAPEEEKTALAGRLAELASRVSGAPAAEAPGTDEKAQPSSVESTRLVGLLESLAQRLEDRTR